MVELIWDERFKKIYKKWFHQHPELKAQFAKKINVANEGIIFPIKNDSNKGKNDRPVVNYLTNLSTRTIRPINT